MVNKFQGLNGEELLMVKVSTRPQEVFTLTLTRGAKPTRGQRLITVAQSTKCCALYETASKKHEADGKNDSERRRRQSTTSLLYVEV